MHDRGTPSVTFGDSSLKEGAKDEGRGFFGLWPQNDRVRTWFFFVWGAVSAWRAAAGRPYKDGKALG